MAIINLDGNGVPGGQPVAGTGLLKTTNGSLGLGVAGTDYESPLTFSGPTVSRIGNNVTIDASGSGAYAYDAAQLATALGLTLDTTGAADCAPVINAILESLSPGTKGVRIFFRRGTYRLNSPVYFNRPVILCGEGGMVFRQTEFRLYNRTTGFIISSPYDGTGERGDGGVIEDIGIVSMEGASDWNAGTILFTGDNIKPSAAFRNATANAIAGYNGYYYTVKNGVVGAGAVEPSWGSHITPGEIWTDGNGVQWETKQQYGIVSYGRTRLRNIRIDAISGHGWYVYGDPSGTPNSETNLCYAECVKIDSCLGDGLRVTGGSANASHFCLVDSTANNGWGIRDDSDLGNFYYTCHTRDNRGGPYKLTSGNGAGVLFGCYSEGGQADGSHVTGACFAIGGCHYSNFNQASIGNLQLGASGEINHVLNVVNKWALQQFIVRLAHGAAGAEAKILDFSVANDGRGFVETGRLERGQLGNSDFRDMWGMVDGNMSQAIWGWTGHKAAQSARFYVPRGVQIGLNQSTTPVYLHADSTMLNDGEYRNKGDRFLYAGSLLALGGRDGRRVIVAGRAFDRWKVNTAYTVGQMVADSNGKIQRCTTAGTSHATTEPTWATTRGTTTADNGTLVWTLGAGEANYATNTDYADYALVYVPANGYVFEAHRPRGTTGQLRSGGSAPGWVASQIGAATTDNNIVWRCKYDAVLAARWEEFGSGAGSYL